MPSFPLRIESRPGKSEQATIMLGSAGVGSAVVLGSGPAAVVRVGLMFSAGYLPDAAAEQIAAIVTGYAIGLARRNQLFPSNQDFGIQIEVPDREVPQ